MSGPPISCRPRWLDPGTPGAGPGNADKPPHLPGRAEGPTRPALPAPVPPRTGPLTTLKDKLRALGREVLTLYIAARDRRTPLLARLIAGVTAAYALSPIDLIPDFVPVLGLLDDLVIVPLGIWLALRLIPDQLMAEYRKLAERFETRPVSQVGLVMVIALWLLIAAFTGLVLLGR